MVLARNPPKQQQQRIRQQQTRASQRACLKPIVQRTQRGGKEMRPKAQSGMGEAENVRWFRKRAA